MRLALITTAALLLGAATSQADTAVDGVISTLRAQGFEGFEVSRSTDQVKIEAKNDTIERELTYDADTGRLVSDETNLVASRQGRGADDAPGDRHGRRGQSDDKASDDKGGDRHGGRSSDDNGSDDKGSRGSDDHGSDDHGGRGSDDHGGGRGGHGGGHDDSGNDDSGNDDSGGDDSSGRG